MKRFDLLDDDLFRGPVLAMNAVPDPLLHRLTDLICTQYHFETCAALQNAGHRVQDAPPGPFSLSLIRLPRVRAEAQAMVAQAWDLTREGGTIAISGGKADGIDTLARGLKKAGLSPMVLPKAHGKLVSFIRSASQPAICDEWQAKGQPSLTNSGFWTQPGVFSADGPDPGSETLASALPSSITGEAADLGAGWGYLSRAILEKNPGLEALHLVEADKRALALARKNVTDPRAAFHWADATAASDLSGRMNAVIMNPPFHQGRADAPSLGQAFIENAAKLLKPKGFLLFVANRHLPYEKTVNAHFAKVSVVGENKAYKVIRAERPAVQKGRR